MVVVVVVVVVLVILILVIVGWIDCNALAAMGCRELGSHARGVHPTQATSRIGTAKIKQEEQADTRIIAESSKKFERQWSQSKT